MVPLTVETFDSFKTIFFPTDANLARIIENRPITDLETFVDSQILFFLVQSILRQDGNFRITVPRELAVDALKYMRLRAPGFIQPFGIEKHTNHTIFILYARKTLQLLMKIQKTLFILIH